MTAPTPDREFCVVAVDISPGERRDEQLGSKPKFWYTAPDGYDYLYKQGRENEDWSEKLAAECGRLMSIPCATVELAECEGRRGIVSRSFLDKKIGDQLVHGNELLLGLDPSYPTAERYHVSKHTLEAALGALQRVNAEAWPNASEEAAGLRGADIFVGYIIFDAWIGNSDRHHENWAIVQRGGSRLIAPSYDHGSSLGRNDPIPRAEARIHGTDPRLTVQGYAEKCRSAFYAGDTAPKPMMSFDAATSAASKFPRAGRYWKERLAAIREADVDNVLARIPNARLPQPYRDLARRLIAYNRLRLIDVLP